MQDKPSFSLKKPAAKKQPAVEAEVLGSHKAKTADIQVTGNRLPFRPGELVKTEQEQKDLDAIGYVPGDALPGDLAERLTTARQKQAISYQNEVEAAKKKKVFSPPAPVDIRTLPASQQQELREAIDAASAEQERLEALAEDRRGIEQLSPGVRAAASAAATATSTVQVVRSKKTDVAATTAVEAEPPNQNAGEEQPIETGAVSQRTTCQHCNWPLNEPEKITPTRSDVADFATAILGGQPFRKLVTLLGGALRVVYRSLPTRAAELGLKQISIDRRVGRLSDTDDFWRLLWDYRLVAGLDKVSFGAETYDVAREVDAAINDPTPFDEPDHVDDTVLPQLVAAITKQTGFSDESVWRMLGQSFKRFNDLVEALEARADDPSFW